MATTWPAKDGPRRFKEHCVRKQESPSGCGCAYRAARRLYLFSSSSGDLVLRDDPQLNGMVSLTQFKLSATPDGLTETNQTVTQGLGIVSPRVGKVTTTFTKAADTTTETVEVTEPNGLTRDALVMSRVKLHFGFSDEFTADVATYDAMDESGHRDCAAKVRINMQPSIAGTYFLGEGDGRSWEIDFFYSVPCSQNGSDMPLDQATFLAASINQQFLVRVTGDPIIFNRGHSVTVVGGPLAQLPGGWWNKNLAIISVTKKVGELVSELSNSRTPWLGFNPGAKYGSTRLIFSAGDADRITLERFLLNRQTAYVIRERRQPTDPWTTLTVAPQYLSPWNDLTESWKLFDSTSLPNINDLVDANGVPKLDDNGVPDGNLKKVMTAGCQNCENPGESMVQFLSGPNHPAYSMAIRNWYGAKSSLVLFGRGLQGDPSRVLAGIPLPNVSGNTGQCPTHKDDDGTVHSMTDDQCAHWLQNAAFMALIIGDPTKVGADVVGAFQVRDNSTFTSDCTGTGSNVSCVLSPQETNLAASYRFDDNGAGIMAAWAALQATGPVGADKLGLNYVYKPNAGSGLLYAMGQSVVRFWLNGDISKTPWLIFALDTPGMMIPGSVDQSMAAMGR